MQQTVHRGARVIGTASPGSYDLLRRFDEEPVEYGDGPEDRLRHLADDGFDAALDAFGSEDAVVASIRLLRDPRRIVSIANGGRASQFGMRFVTGGEPTSAAFRESRRSHVVALAEQGLLRVLMAGTLPLDRAADALEILQQERPGGKVALLP